MVKRCLILAYIVLSASILLCGCSLLAINEAPVPVITAIPQQGTAPLAVSFDALASADDGTIASYSWEIVDSDQAPVSGPAFQQQFERSGSYVVRLTVTDLHGTSATAEQTIQVINSAPIPCCRFSNDAPIPGESVLFDASGSMDTDGQLVDFIWSFGDETVQRGTRVSHTYENVGTYRVQLTVVDNGGDSASVSHTMTVHTAVQGGGCGGGRCGG